MRTWMMMLLGLMAAAAMAGCTPRDQQKESDVKKAQAEEGQEATPKVGSECRVYFKAEVLADTGGNNVEGVKTLHKGDVLEGKIHDVTSDWVALDVPASGPKGFNRLWIAKDSILIVQNKE